MNRIEYKDQDLFKNRHKVAIEKTLYVDRFMHQNKVMSEKLSNNVQKLREHIKNLEQSLQEYTSFGGSDYNILKVFELTKKCFSEQGA